MDKVVDYFNIQVDHIPYYENLDVFLWTIGNTVSPLLLALGYFFNPKKWSLAAPGAAYSIQMMYIFRDVEWIGRDYFWYYSALFFFTMLILVWVFQYIIKDLRSTIQKVNNLKDKIRFIMEKMIVDAKKYVVDKKGYQENIVEKSLNKLDE